MIVSSEMSSTGPLRSSDKPNRILYAWLALCVLGALSVGALGTQASPYRAELGSAAPLITSAFGSNAAASLASWAGLLFAVSVGLPWLVSSDHERVVRGYRLAAAATGMATFAALCAVLAPLAIVRPDSMSVLASVPWETLGLAVAFLSPLPAVGAWLAFARDARQAPPADQLWVECARSAILACPAALVAGALSMALVPALKAPAPLLLATPTAVAGTVVLISCCVALQKQLSRRKPE